MAGSRRRRIEFDAILATISALLFVLTLAWPDWIEATLGVDPDRGNGALEWLVAAALLSAALIAGARAARRVRTS